MLGISVFHAIRDAVASCGEPGARPALVAPATPESILRAIASLSAAAAQAGSQAAPGARA